MLAMESPDSPGKRYLLSSSTCEILLSVCSYLADAGGMWFKEVAEVLKAKFQDQGYNVRQCFRNSNYYYAFRLQISCQVKCGVAPNFLMRIASLWDKEVASVKANLGKEFGPFDNSAFKELLGGTIISKEESVIAMAESLIKFELVQSKSGKK